MVRKYKLLEAEIKRIAKLSYNQGFDKIHEKSFNKWLFMEMAKMEWEKE